MHKTRLASISDEIGKIVIIFAVVFVILRYFIENFYICLAVSLIIAYIINSLINAILFGKKIKLSQKNVLNADIDSYIISFLLMSDEECLNFFAKVFAIDNPIIKDNMLIKGNTCIVPMFAGPDVSWEALARNLQNAKRNNCNKLVVLCNEYKQDFPTTEEVELKVLTKLEVYSLLNNYGVFPSIPISISKKKNYTALINAIFDKRKAKNYAFCGVTMLICSYFVSIKIYYIIFGSLLMLFALFCKLNKRFSQPNQVQNIWE